MIASTAPKTVKAKPRKVPQHLIYEILDGKPVYYKGYREVIQNTCRTTLPFMKRRF